MSLNFSSKPFFIQKQKLKTTFFIMNEKKCDENLDRINNLSYFQNSMISNLRLED